MSAASLTHVTAVVENPAAVAERFQGAFGDCIQAVPLGTGEEVLAFVADSLPVLLLEPGHRLAGGEFRTGVHHVGLAVASPDQVAARLEAKGARILPEPLPGIDGRRWLAIDPATTAGVRVVVSEPLPVEREKTSSDLLERIDHVGIASVDNDAAITAFSRLFGLTLESRQTDAEFQITLETFTSDRYGVTQRAGEPRLVGGVNVAFLRAGEADLEFLQDIDPLPQGTPRSDAASVRRDRSAIARFVERSGPGLHHIALKVSNADEALRALNGSGCRMLDREGRPGSRRSRIGFVHPSSFGGLLLHVVERDPV